MQFATVQKHPRYPVHVPIDVVTAAAEIISLPLENISYGGLFACTNTPAPPGYELRMRLRAQTAFGLTGRVVHVIEPDLALRKDHPPGMGVRFEGLTPQSEALLKHFVDGLAAEAMRQRVRSAMVRFVDVHTVVVNPERAVVGALWSSGLDKGGMYAEGAPPGLGMAVRVVIGPVHLNAEVVHVEGTRGAGLHVLDLIGDKRAAIQRFAEGITPTIEFAREVAAGPPLGKVLAAARRLFTGVEENDPFGGVGLPETATPEEINERIAGLVRLFSAPRGDLSPPQAARLEHAVRTLERLAPALRARSAALRNEAILAMRPRHDDEVRALTAEASLLSAKGERETARKVLQKALALDSENESLKKRIATLTEAIDLQHAVDMLDKAIVFADGVGMRRQAIELARDAVKLSTLREVRLRAVKVLAKSGELDEAAALAELLVSADPRDAIALSALLTLREKMRMWREATKAGEALLRVKRNDLELKRRVEKLAALARKG